MGLIDEKGYSVFLKWRFYWVFPVSVLLGLNKKKITNDPKLQREYQNDKYYCMPIIQNKALWVLDTHCK